jgi:hypothetical protein
LVLLATPRKGRARGYDEVMRGPSFAIAGGVAALAVACGNGAGTSSTAAGGSGASASNGPSMSTSMSGSMSTSSTASSMSTASGMGGAEACLGSNLLSSLGKDHVLVGVSADPSTAASAPFDIHYEYISGGIADGAGPCGSCATGCTAGGTSCANAAGGCAWWGCWQSDQDPPGGYVRGLVSAASGQGQIPMITYYMVLQASGVNEGQPEVDVMNDQAFLTRYFADFRFLLQQLGTGPAIVHVEPDFWGYAEQGNSDPHAIPAAVPAANPTDCGSEEASIAGLGRCFVAMTRKYAPNAKIALHGSAWATNMDVLINSDPNFDVAGEAAKLGNFLKECGDMDLVVVDAADRDAGYYESIGRDDWWDDTNATLPNFNQAFAWSKALSETMGKPHLWWQVPVGNMNLPNIPKQWKDNRVDYFFGHWADVAFAHGLGAAFGAGAGDQTNPSTDGGNLVTKTQGYANVGSQAFCQ